MASGQCSFKYVLKKSLIGKIFQKQSGHFWAQDNELVNTSIIKMHDVFGLIFPQEFEHLINLFHP